MAAETIKSFLVSVDWQSNEADQRKFFQGVEIATLKAKLLGDVIEDMARRVADSLDRASTGFNDLFNAAKLSGASASMIKDFEFAITKLTGSAAVGADAVAKLVNMGERAFEQPGLARAFEKAGFHIDAVTHKMTINMAALKHFGEMTGAEAGIWRQESGLTPLEMQTLRDFAGIQKAMAESAASSKAAGFFPEGAAQDGKQFLETLNEIQLKISDLGKAGLDDLMKAFQKPLEEFDGWLKANEGKLGEEISEIVGYIKQLTDQGVAMAENGGLGAKFTTGIQEFSGDVKELVGDLHDMVGGMIEVDKFLHDRETKSGRAADDQLAKSTPTFDESKKGYVGQFIDWIFGPAQAGGGGAAGKPWGLFNFDKGLSRGLGGKSIDLERAEDGGSNGTAFGNGAARGIEVNGTKVGPGNPLPVTLDKYGFGSDGSGAGSGTGSAGGGGLLGAIGDGVRRAFGGGGAGGSDTAPSLGGSTGGAIGKGLAGYMQVYNLAKAAGDKFPEVTAAQWANESNWGKSPSGKNNFFGQMARRGEAGTLRHNAIEGGASRYKDYDTPEAGIADHERKWSSKYANASSPDEAIRILQAHGYATAGNYIPAIEGFMRQGERGRLAALAKLPQLQPGYFATSPGGSSTSHSVVTGSHNTISNVIHVTGDDPEITARMIGSHVDRTASGIIRNLRGPVQ
jgi:hypothetical protein